MNLDSSILFLFLDIETVERRDVFRRTHKRGVLVGSEADAFGKPPKSVYKERTIELIVDI